jgi:hypothetical protein
LHENTYSSLLLLGNTRAVSGLVCADDEIAWEMMETTDTWTTGMSTAQPMMICMWLIALSRFLLASQGMSRYLSLWILLIEKVAISGLDFCRRALFVYLDLIKLLKIVTPFLVVGHCQSFVPYFVF